METKPESKINLHYPQIVELIISEKYYPQIVHLIC